MNTIINRRKFLGATFGGLLVIPIDALAQQRTKVIRIALLDYSAPDPVRLSWWKAHRDRYASWGTWKDRTLCLSLGGETGRWTVFRVLLPN